MDVHARVDKKTDRIGAIAMVAKSFEEERILAGILDAVQSHKQIHIVSVGEFGSDEIEQVFHFTDGKKT